MKTLRRFAEIVIADKQEDLLNALKSIVRGNPLLIQSRGNTSVD
jgi:hypothetical protein